jgi:type IV pilus assembly protein PilC
MPIYSYTAIDNRGVIQRASIVAAAPSAAAAALIGRGLTPLAIVATEDRGVDFKKLFNQLGIVRLREIVLLLRMMAALIASGITITEAIAVLHEQSRNRKLKWILGEVKMQIEGGVSFSDALRQFPKVFPETVVNMIRAGELGGILAEVLRNLVDYLEKQAALKKMILRSFFYPAIVLVVAIAVVVFLVVFVIPRFTVLLQGGSLPWNTQFLLDLAGFLTGNAKEIIFGLIGAVALTVLLFVLHESRRVIDQYKVYLPVLGPIFRLGVIVQFNQTLGSLLASGIPLVEALTSTNAILTNRAAKRAVDRAAERVIAGEQLSTVLAGEKIFTPMMVSLVRIGEQSGNLDDQVLLVAELYTQELEDRIKWMSAMIEPALIITLGGVVGFVAWALVAGMLSMYRMGA